MSKIFNKRYKNAEENDFYATDPVAIDYLMELEKDPSNRISFSKNIIEPCVGQGHLADRLSFYGKNITAYDIVNRNYPDTIVKRAQDIGVPNDCSIITNPPYKEAQEIIESLLGKMLEGQQLAMFLKLVFLESKTRLQFYKTNPPRYVAVFTSRVLCAKDGDFEAYKSPPATYAWFIWEKGYKGNPEILFIDNGVKKKSTDEFNDI